MPAPTTTRFGMALGTRPNIIDPLPSLVSGTGRLMWIGDSIANGANDPTPVGYGARQNVGEMLTDAGIAYVSVGDLTTGPPAWPNHRAITGQTINTFTTVDFTGGRIATADPDVLLICPCGYNDIHADGQTGAQTLTRWTALLENIRGYTNGRGFTPRIIGSYLSGASTGHDAEIDAFNAGLAAAAAAQVALGQYVTLVDPRPIFNGPIVAPATTMAPRFTLDGLHPNRKGNRLYASLIIPHVQNALGRNATYGRWTL